MAASPFVLKTAPQQRLQNWIGGLTLLAVSLIGALSFLSPFWARSLQTADSTTSHVADSPMITFVLSVACLVVVFANLGPALSSKSVALLGVLVGINIVLRMIDQSFLPPGEFSPIFLLITLVGYTFGAQLGFLMGALTLLCSAFFTGGIGPWLPFQMITAGWMGLSAAWLRGSPRVKLQREVIKLAVFGFVWGFLYGIIINLYFWPFMAGESAIIYQPGLAINAAFNRYIAFYLLQSIGPDLARAIGNLALLLLLGKPLLQAFWRFRSRFEYHVVRVEG